MNLLPVSPLSAPAHAQATHLSGGALRAAGPAEQRAAVGAQFEAIMVRQLLGPTMTRMMGKEGGAAANVYGDLMTETLAAQLSSGSGLGLGRLLERQLAPRGMAPPVLPAVVSAGGPVSRSTPGAP